MEKHLPRKLAVILYADVAGYSRLTGEDEDATHRTLNTYLDLFSSKIELHRGQVVHYAGDAVLAKFDAVVDALSCAFAVQDELALKNENLPEHRKLQFRMGVNLGDVIEDRGEISGDGVNVAARLESLAEPGGICISESVRTAVGDTLPLTYQDIGEQRVKNIKRLVHAYYLRRQPGVELPEPSRRPLAKERNRRLVFGATTAILVVVVVTLAWFAPWSPSKDTTFGDESVLALPDKPSIAVLPFENLSGDPDQVGFTDGLAENIITSLSRFDDLFVIARHSSFQYKGKSVDIRDVGRDLGVRYVLEGSVQRSKDRIRVTAQLINAATGGHVWADQIDRPLDIQFEVQDEITDHIVSVIAPVGAGTGKLQKVELKRVARTPTESLQAYDYFLRGVTHFERFNEKDNLSARQLFEKAVEIDPNYARAKAKIAWTYLSEYWNGWGEPSEDTLSKVVEFAQAAIASDPNDAWGYWSKGSASLFQRQHDAAIAAYQRAVELSPNEADVLIEYGFALVYAGLPEDGILLMQDAIRLNPYYPGWYLWDLAWGYFVARRYKEAITTLEKREPKSNFTYLFLAACYAQVDRVEEATKAMKQFLKLEPGYSIELAATTEPFKHPQELEHWLSALRKAGLPETPSSELSNGS